MLGQWHYGLNLSELVSAGEARHDPPSGLYDKTNQQIVDALKQLMIRHTKSQQIRGFTLLATALPRRQSARTVRAARPFRNCWNTST